jgi:YVTN family beta-propeller protein
MPRRPLLAVLAVVLLSGLTACQQDSSSTPRADTPDPDATVSPSASSPVLPRTASIETGSKPCGILGAAGKVWVSNYGDDNLVSIDPDTMVVSAPTPVGVSPCGLAYGAGSIWVENYGDNTVTRVDATDGEVQDTYDVGGAPYDVTFAGGSAWVTNFADGTLSRIDAATGRTTTIKTGGTPIGIAPAGGKVWVGLGSDGIVGVDVATGRVAKRVEAGGTAGWTAYDGDTVWVNVGEQTWQVDGRSGRIAKRFDVGSAPADGSVVAGDVIVPDQSGEVYRIHAGEVSGPFHTGLANPFVLVGYRGLIWAVDFLGHDVAAFAPAALD